MSVPCLWVEWREHCRVPVGHHHHGTAADAGCPLQTEYARLENGRFVYRIHRSPMCEYMINFIHKLKHLPEKYMMNSVLENFTILQVPPLLFQGLCPTCSDPAGPTYTRLCLDKSTR